MSSTVLKVLYWALAIAYCVLFLSSDYIFLHDYPMWAYEGILFQKKLLGDTLAHYTLKPYPVPNSLISIVVAIAAYPLGFNVASKLVIVAYILLSFWVVARLCQKIDPRFAIQKSYLVVATVFISSCFWNGYINYQFGLLLLAAYVLLDLERDKQANLPLLGFSILIFFTHLVPFLMLFAYVAHRAYRDKDMFRVAPLVPSVLLGIWYALSRFGGSIYERPDPESAVLPGIIYFLAYKTYTLLKLGPFQNFILSDGSSYLEKYYSAYLVFIAISALFLALVGFNVLRDVWRRWRQSGLYGVPGLVLGAVAIFMVTPPIMLSVVNLGERFVIPVFATLLMWTRLPRVHLVALVSIALFFSVLNLKFMYDVRNVSLHPALPEQTTTAESLSEQAAIAKPITGSAEFFRSLNARTKQKLLNHHVFRLLGYYKAIERSDWSLPIWGTGLMVDNDMRRDSVETRN